MVTFFIDGELSAHLTAISSLSQSLHGFTIKSMVHKWMHSISLCLMDFSGLLSEREAATRTRWKGQEVFQEILSRRSVPQRVPNCFILIPGHTHTVAKLQIVEGLQVVSLRES